MDVPISVGVILVTGMSLAQTMQGGAHTYFDSAITLLFFLLIGRVLDHRARGQARATAEQLLTLRAADVAVLAAGRQHRSGAASNRSRQGDRVLVGSGERIGVDGVVERGIIVARRQPGDRREPAGRGDARHAGIRRHAEPGRGADGARDRHRRRPRCWPNACG